MQSAVFVSGFFFSLFSTIYNKSLLSDSYMGWLHMAHSHFTDLNCDMTNQQNECAPSEDSDQPGHPPSLIRVKDPSFLHADSKTDQTVWMPRLI